MAHTPQQADQICLFPQVGGGVIATAYSQIQEGKLNDTLCHEIHSKHLYFETLKQVK